MPSTTGRRVVVYGWTGSGKTTVARRIGGALGLPVIELDALFWSPGGWQHLERDEFRSATLEALAACPEGWVCDGDYSHVRDLILPQADTVVLLRLPFRVTYTRLWKRTLHRMWTRELLWGKNRESFLSRGSLLLSALKEPLNDASGVRHMRQELDSYGRRVSLVELRSQRDVERFLAELRG